MLLCACTASVANAVTFAVAKTADTDDGTCDADCSLHEAIDAVNVTPGSQTIAFNIPIGAGAAVISIGGPLPAITRNNTVIDGTTQTANVGNTNPVTLGSGGTVGVDALPLSTVAGPEIEIRDAAAIAQHRFVRNILPAGRRLR